MNLSEERMKKALVRCYSLGMIELQHFIQQVKGSFIMDLTDLLPINTVFLHFIWDQTPVTKFEGYFFDIIRAEETHKGDQI